MDLGPCNIIKGILRLKTIVRGHRWVRMRTNDESLTTCRHLFRVDLLGQGRVRLHAVYHYPLARSLLPRL